MGRLLSRGGRSYKEEHLRLQLSPNTYNQEDDVLPARNFGGVLGSYPGGRLYLGLPTFTKRSLLHSKAGFYWGLLRALIMANRGPSRDTENSKCSERFAS